MQQSTLVLLVRSPMKPVRTLSLIVRIALQESTVRLLDLPNQAVFVWEDLSVLAQQLLLLPLIIVQDGSALLASSAPKDLPLLLHAAPGCTVPLMVLMSRLAIALLATTALLEPLTRLLSMEGLETSVRQGHTAWRVLTLPRTVQLEHSVVGLAMMSLQTVEPVLLGTTASQLD